MFKIYLPPVVLDYVTFSEPNTLSLEAFDAYQGYFFQYELTLNDKTNILTRKEWNFLDLFSAIGGIMETLSIFFSTILVPLADHSFVLAAIQSLYLVKQTKYHELFM